jgi:hypothetical protein
MPKKIYARPRKSPPSHPSSERNSLKKVVRGQRSEVSACGGEHILFLKKHNMTQITGAYMKSAQILKICVIWCAICRRRR